MGKASDRFYSRFHFAFADGHSNKYHLFLFGKKRHWQRSTLPIVIGFGQIYYTISVKNINIFKRMKFGFKLLVENEIAPKVKLFIIKVKVKVKVKLTIECSINLSRSSVKY